MVGDRHRCRRFRGARVEIGGIGFELAREDLLAADAIDCHVAGALDEPGAWMLWHPVVAPAAHRGLEGLLRRLFGDTEIAGQADHRREYAAPIGAVTCRNDGIDALGHDGS
jgi:hypothetical protein